MEKEYLVETKKALKIVERKLREFEHGPTRKERIARLEKFFKKAVDFEDLQELKAERESLEFQEMKNIPEQPIPEEVKERILSNHEIEMKVLREDIHKKYSELEQHFSEFKTKVEPILKELNQLHACENSVNRLGPLLNRTYGYSIGGNFITSSYDLPLDTGINKHYAHSFLKKLAELNKLTGGEK